MNRHTDNDTYKLTQLNKNIYECDCKNKGAANDCNWMSSNTWTWLTVKVKEDIERKGKKAFCESLWSCSTGSGQTLVTWPILGNVKGREVAWHLKSGGESYPPPPSSLKITQAPCVQSVGTETHWGFLPATVGNLYPNLNHNRPMKELLQQKQSYKTVIGHSVCPNKINLFSKHHSSQYHKKLDHTPLSFTHMPELLTSPFFLFVLSLCVLDCALFLWSLIVNCIKSIKY